MYNEKINFWVTEELKENFKEYCEEVEEKSMSEVIRKFMEKNKKYSIRVNWTEFEGEDKKITVRVPSWLKKKFKNESEETMSYRLRQFVEMYGRENRWRKDDLLQSVLKSINDNTKKSGLAKEMEKIRDDNS